MEILINPPKEIFITKEQFENFTYNDIACFWCNWRIAFTFLENKDIKMYTHNECFVNYCMKNYRFKNIKWYVNESSETFNCVIPKDNNMYKFIINKLNHLIMK